MQLSIRHLNEGYNVWEFYSVFIFLTFILPLNVYELVSQILDENQNAKICESDCYETDKFLVEHLHRSETNFCYHSYNFVGTYKTNPRNNTTHVCFIRRIKMQYFLYK